MEKEECIHFTQKIEPFSTTDTVHKFGCGSTLHIWILVEIHAPYTTIVVFTRCFFFQHHTHPFIGYELFVKKSCI